MKTRRTFVSILAVLSIFISCTPHSFASRVTDPDSILLKRGYPQEVLDSLSEALKVFLSILQATVLFPFPVSALTMSEAAKSLSV